MWGNVKNPKTPHQWDEVGRVLFRYNEIELYPRAKLNISSKQRTHSFQVYGRWNIVSGTPSPHIHTRTHTYTFTDLKGNYCIYLSQRNAYSLRHLSLSFSVSYHLTSQYPFLVFFSACRSSPKHPHFALPGTSYLSPQHVVWRFVRRREFSRT